VPPVDEGSSIRVSRTEAGGRRLWGEVATQEREGGVATCGGHGGFRVDLGRRGSEGERWKRQMVWGGGEDELGLGFVGFIYN
jgi:hypothetical protein